MTRRNLLRLAALGGAYMTLNPPAACADGDATPAPALIGPLLIDEITIPQIQAAMQYGRASAVSLTQHYLRRIAEIDKAGPSVNAIIEINPDALDIARALDEERKTKGPRGPLHGVPVVVKDNLDTHDKMMTTAGSLALLGSIAPRDS